MIESESLVTTAAAMNLHGRQCAACNEAIDATQNVIECDGEVYHEECFVCAQCFQAFPDDGFYYFEDKRYCLHDYQLLYAPICQRCQNFVEGEVVKAINYDWCPDCFTCEECNTVLFEKQFWPCKIRGRTGQTTVKVVCDGCYVKFRRDQQNKNIDLCQFCWRDIDDEEKKANLKLRFKGDPYHCYHFTCTQCNCELGPGSTEYMGQLLCRKCHDQTEIPVCGACRRPVEGRVVRALDKSWHIEHFVCNYCEKPFMNDTYFVGPSDDKPYCEYHYNKLFGDSCTYCGCVIQTQVIAAFEKRWCTGCFQCYCCSRPMTPREKFVEYDMKPVCKKCFDRFPYELKKRLKKSADYATKDKKTQIKNTKKHQPSTG